MSLGPKMIIYILSDLQMIFCFPHSVRKCDKLASDASVMTYRGHRVLQTAIRCRFSPTVTTGNVRDYLKIFCGSIVLVNG